MDLHEVFQHSIAKPQLWILFRKLENEKAMAVSMDLPTFPRTFPGNLGKIRIFSASSRRCSSPKVSRASSMHFRRVLERSSFPQIKQDPFWRILDADAFVLVKYTTH